MWTVEFYVLHRLFRFVSERSLQLPLMSDAWWALLLAGGQIEPHEFYISVQKRAAAAAAIGCSSVKLLRKGLKQRRLSLRLQTLKPGWWYWISRRKKKKKYFHGKQPVGIIEKIKSFLLRNSKSNVVYRWGLVWSFQWHPSFFRVLINLYLIHVLPAFSPSITFPLNQKCCSPLCLTNTFGWTPCIW